MAYPETLPEPCKFAISVTDPPVIEPASSVPPLVASKLALMFAGPIEIAETPAQAETLVFMQIGPPEYLAGKVVNGKTRVTLVGEGPVW
jgi:hypothetical protein